MGARGVDGPVVAVTGTPGSGKTTACEILAAAGHAVLSLARYRDDSRFDLGPDAGRSGTHVIDEEALAAHLAEHLAEELPRRAPFGDPVFLEGHFAHELGIADRILVLRTSPRVLRKRLAGRGWSEAKVRENLEAEATDIILQEAVSARERAQAAGHIVDVGEIDTTHADADTTARTILRLATADAVQLEIGLTDWSDEVLEWY